jgi:uncharacterized phiE125 gp8 family phage protein
VTAWDRGVTLRLVRTEAPDASSDPLTLAATRDDHLRSPNGTAEDTYIERLIRVSLRMAERRTRRVLLTQTWQLVMDRFPCGAIELPIAPVQSVTSIAYIDPDGVEQTFGGSPLPYELLNPTLESNVRACVVLAYDQAWPATRTQRDAVTVTLVAGYPDVGSPAVADVPEDITQGRLLVIGELYKQRSESVHAMSQNPALRGADGLWDAWRVF